MYSLDVFLSQFGTSILFHVQFYLLLLDWHAGFPGGAIDKEPACQCKRLKRHMFDPWVGKIPWRRAWQPTLVFLPEESALTEEPGRLQSMVLQRFRHS